jgi:hypothetical protein
VWRRHGELQDVAVGGGGGDGEGVLGGGDRALQPQPGELAGREGEGDVLPRVAAAAPVEHERAHRGRLGPHLAHHELRGRVGPGPQHPAVQQHGEQQHGEQAQHRAEHGVGDELLEVPDVQRAADHDEPGEADVAPAPQLVGQVLGAGARQGEADEQPDRDRGERGGGGGAGGVARHEQHGVGRVGGHHAGQVEQHERGGEHPEAAVHLQDALDAEGPRQRPDAGRQDGGGHDGGQREETGDRGQLRPQGRRRREHHPQQHRTGEHDAERGDPHRAHGGDVPGLHAGNRRSGDGARVATLRASPARRRATCDERQGIGPNANAIAPNAS